MLLPFKRSKVCNKNFPHSFLQKAQWHTGRKYTVLRAFLAFLFIINGVDSRKRQDNKSLVAFETRW